MRKKIKNPECLRCGLLKSTVDECNVSCTVYGTTYKSHRYNEESKIMTNNKARDEIRSSKEVDSILMTILRKLIKSEKWASENPNEMVDRYGVYSAGSDISDYIQSLLYQERLKVIEEVKEKVDKLIGEIIQTSGESSSDAWFDGLWCARPSVEQLLSKLLEETK